MIYTGKLKSIVPEGDMPRVRDIGVRYLMGAGRKASVDTSTRGLPIGHVELNYDFVYVDISPDPDQAVQVLKRETGYDHYIPSPLVARTSSRKVIVALDHNQTPLRKLDDIPFYRAEGIFNGLEIQAEGVETPEGVQIEIFSDHPNAFQILKRSRIGQYLQLPE